MNYTKSFILITFFLFLYTDHSAFAVNADQYEPDNSATSANTLQPGIVQSHTFHVVNDIDWIKFTTVGTENIELKTSGLEGGQEITLYSSNLSMIGNSKGYAGAFAVLNSNGLSPGTYYAKIEDYENNDINNGYNISLTTTIGNGDNYEADNIPSEASAANLGGIQNRSIIPSNDLDWVQFKLNSIDNIELKTIGLQGGLKITLYSSNLTQIAADTGYASSHPVLRAKGLNTGYYYAMIEDYGNNDINNSYNFSLRTSNSNGDALEPDNSSLNAKTISPGNPLAHSIIPANDQDWIKFSLNETDNIKLRTSGVSGGTSIKLYDSNFTLIAGNNGYAGSHANLTKTGLSPGTYYAVISDYGENNENSLYYLHFSATHVTPPTGTLHTNITPILQLLLE